MRTLFFGLLVLPFIGHSPAVISVAATPAAAALPSVHGALGVYVRGPARLQAGTPAALRIATHWASSETASGPWPDVDVAVRLRGHGRDQLLVRGRSDADGVVDARFTVPEWPPAEYTVLVEANAAAATAQKVARPVTLAPAARLLLESDKPLYQPAQVIHLRALAMRPLDGRPLSSGEVTFVVSDPRGNEVFRQARPLSPFGVAAADFALADEILTGTYVARVERDEAAPSTLALPVARYVLPKIKVGLDTDRRWYRPGDEVALTIDARYFFGKPVAGGRATVSVELSGGSGVRAAVERLSGRLDANGKLALRTRLPAAAAATTLSLRAEVSDAADHREQATRELPLSSDGVELELTGEGSTLVPGVPNRVWLATARPDGTPLAGAAVELRVDGVVHALRTDAIGVASLEVTPAVASTPARGACSGNALAVTATVAHDGARASTARCFPLAPAGTLLVRSDRAFYAVGAPIGIDVYDGDGGSGVAYVDVVKDGQLVDTTRVSVSGGVGHAVLPPDARRFGTLALAAYRIAADGTQRHSSRVVYVERPAALRVDVHTEPSYRPGERGRIRLHVVDAQSGAGTRAQLGVVMVDQSLLALKAIKPGAARVYFSLAEEATRAERLRMVKPAGYTVERLVEEGNVDALRDEAAEILLAGAAPPWSGIEHDPWRERREEAVTQAQRIAAALRAWTHHHAAGEQLHDGHWRWVRGLLARVMADGALAAGDGRDPWSRAVGDEAALAMAGLSDFDRFAQDDVSARLYDIYAAFARSGFDRKLARDPSERRAAVVLTLADVERLVSAGHLPRGLLRDPWGRPWHIVVRKWPLRVGNIRSRYLLASAGPDARRDSGDDLVAVGYRWGRNAADFDVFGLPKGEVMLRGVGAGGGGFGFGSVGGVSGGRAFGAIGHGTGSGFGVALAGSSGSGEATRVRRDFPETMLWLPALTTDEHGDASVDVDMADSITTWRLYAEAVAGDGRLGQAAVDVRVFQDFFVDVDLPPVMTQHDELAVPVAVYNYLGTRQRVTLTLDEAQWFNHSGAAEQTIELGPSEVGVRYFRIRLEGLGRQRLRVRARGSQAADAVEKTVDIHPDGVERDVAFQDQIDPGRRQHMLTLPANAVAGASLVSLKLYPSTATHVLEGLDSMLRMPGGCFEQTSSTTYPNALILDYLRRTHKATPEIEKRAHQYLAAGWQRLLSFEVPGGGFSWFGTAPANQVLTAYGLEEFHDMARVHPIDARVLERTQRWLAGRQRSDGSWAPDRSFINEGATTHFNSDMVRISAYIAGALAHSGYRGPAVERARAFVRRALRERPSHDAYTLALVAELEADDPAAPLDALLDRLWDQRQDNGRTTSFAAVDKTLTYGDGRAGQVETTARAARSLMRGHAPHARVARAVDYLIGAKDSFGNWYSTQATILSLKALLDFGASAKPARGRVAVLVDGRDAGVVEVDAARLTLDTLDLPALAQPGAHQVELRFDGSGQLAYQLVGRWYEPHQAAVASSASPAPLAVTTRFDREHVAPGEALVEHVQASTQAALDMPIVTAGLPPGCDVDGEELDALVRTHVVSKVQRSASGLVFYLTRLEPGAPFRVALHLRARFPEVVQVPAATLYEYYRPERRAVGAPLVVTVGS